VLTNVDVSLPLDSADKEPISLAEDPGAARWTAEVVVRLCRSMESIETIDDALERTGEMMWSLPPQLNT